MKVYKRHVTLLMVIMILSVMTALAGMAPKARAATLPGSFCTYLMDYRTGVLTISGKGELPLAVSRFWSRDISSGIDAESVKSVVISEGITTISNSLFSACNNLTSVKLPSTLKKIGDYTFAGCVKLNTISLPSGLESIGNYCFANDKSLKTIIIPNTVKQIGSGVLQGCTSLTGVTLSKSLTEIPMTAFASCTSLTSLTIPVSVTTIGHMAFDRCTSLKSLTFPAGITKLAYIMFQRCSSLTNFYVANGSVFSSKDGLIYNKAGTELVLCPSGRTNVVIPEGVTSLRENAIYECEQLVSVKFPKSLKVIGSNLNLCSSLTSIDFGGVESIEDSFYQCSSITNLYIPGTVKKVAGFGDCQNLSSVTFGEGVETIEYAFGGCPIKSLSLPDSIRTIRRSFHNCKLNSVYLPGGIDTIQDSFSDALELTQVYIGDGIQSITGSFGTGLFGTSKLTELVLPESITDITGSFWQCSGLKSIYFKGPAPKGDTEPSSFTAFGYNTTLYYLEGQLGWTSPKWTKYNSAVWTPPAPEMNHFSLSNVVYKTGLFSDVNENAWYGENGQGAIGTAVRLGIMSGIGNGMFSPNGKMTAAEAIKMAAVVHQVYNTGSSSFQGSDPWYQVYIDYAVANGIIDSGDFRDYNAPITRAQLAYIFSHALPAGELPAVNNILKIPDVTAGDLHSSEIYQLYNAGILTGCDAEGTFNPRRSITRAEAAAVITRMAIADKRVI